ncbi:hypothetical protein JQC92_01210 [Shewanella sp. 202IG2-18]|uniref:tetratricopeptide repeat protein n=1 Tax=Parashewanella hymeniacidonis TaxID=2807618 RepID=UPI00195F6265|nr:hypothetical protein [Parashewanella hymeniacidonis]MBM7070661.1 hypothetical protein [Parashewanella hymeniacidonis]
MSREVFAQIRELKQKGQYVEAWNIGLPVFQNDIHNTFLRTSLFWVCFAAIKSVQTQVQNRQNKAPNQQEQQTVNAWINCISQLNLQVPCEELDYRFFNLFRGCGEHYEVYIQMLTYYGGALYQANDFQPYQSDKGESPSLVVRLARQASKAWLQHHGHWNLNLDSVLNLLNFALKNAKDRNKTWLQFDISRCLSSAGRYDESRKFALNVLKQKMSESWAWAALADTYFASNSSAAIACYCKGIREAHEPSFRIPMYFGLVKAYEESGEYNLASACLSMLIDVYSKNGWPLKSEYEDFIQRSWFDAAYIELFDFESHISKFADKALQFATEKMESAIGIVDSHHRSGKGFSIYFDIEKKVSARKGIFFGKGLPDIGTWVEVKLAIDDSEASALEVHRVDPQVSERVIYVEGDLKLNPKGFGFVNDAFIAPYLLSDFKDGENVSAIKVWDRDPKKGTPSWRVIKLAKLSSKAVTY